MPLAFAALCELIARASSLRRALLIGWGFGVGQFAVGLNWIATAFTFQAAMPAWLGWIAVVLLSLYLAIYPMLAAGLAWKFGREQAACPGSRARRRLGDHRMAPRRRCSPASPGTRSVSRSPTRRCSRRAALSALMACRHSRGSDRRCRVAPGEARLQGARWDSLPRSCCFGPSQPHRPRMRPTTGRSASSSPTSASRTNGGPASRRSRREGSTS